jgi:hypothetical protein
MSNTHHPSGGCRVYGLTEWLEWLDRAATSIYGLSGAGFEAAYRAGFFGPGPADDLASVLPLIERLRLRTEGRRAPPLTRRGSDLS